MAVLMAEIDTVRNGYAELCRQIRTRGKAIEPRGLGCREVHGFVVIRHPWVDAMPHGLGRNLNVAIGAVEALNVLGGVSTPRLLEKVSANFGNFMDGEVLAGAYGPRLRWQLPQVQRRLTSDRDSRQAVLQIYDPTYDTYGETRDVPCTLNLQFAIRDDELHLTVNMRSNDVWWGFAYDVFQFAQLQVAMANALDLECGPYAHHATSLHLYDRDADKVDALGYEDAANGVPILAPQIELGTGPIERYQEAARSLLELPPHPVEGDHHGWYGRTLDRYK